MTDDVIKVDFGDGVSAVDRTMRAITMAADGAVGELLNLGWTRKSVNLQIDSDNPLPCYVTLRKRPVFRIVAKAEDDGRITIQGEWLETPKGPGILDRWRGA